MREILTQRSFRFFLLFTFLFLVGCGQVKLVAPTSQAVKPQTLNNKSQLQTPPHIKTNPVNQLKSTDNKDFRIKLVRTTASGAIRRIFDNPVYSVSSSVAITGPANDQIFVNVGDNFSITGIINANPGPILDLTPISVTPSGIVNITNTTINASGTTLTIDALSVGTTTVTFSNQYYGMYFDVIITVGPGGGPPPPATIEFQAAAFSAGEAAGTMAVNLVRGGTTTTAVSATVSLTDISATGGAALPADYNNAPIVVNFPVGVTTQTINIPIFDDVASEPTEAFTMTLGGYSAGAVAGTLTSSQGNIVDDDILAPADVSFFTPQHIPLYTWGENNSPMQVQLMRTGNSASAISVDISLTDLTANGGAALPADFNNAVVTVPFPAGVTQVTAAIPLFDDALIEGTETFTLTLVNPSAGANIVAPSTATATIIDDDFLPVSDVLTAPSTQITFGVPAAPNAVKSIRVEGPGPVTGTLFIDPISGTSIPDIVSAWKAEGNGNDELGTNNGTLIGGTGFVVGQTGQAFSLDGVNDVVLVNPATMPTTDITVAYWINTADTTKQGSAFSYATAASNNEFLIFDYRNIRIFRGGASLATGVAVNDGNWHHVAASWRSSDGRTQLFVDGVLSFTGNMATGTSIGAPGAIALGQEQDSVGGGFAVNQACLCSLDEVYMFSRELTPGEITDVMNDNVNTGGATPTQLLTAIALDNPGNPVAGVVDYVWRFSNTVPFPGILKYPAGAAGTPNNQAEFTPQLTGTGSVDLIAENLTTGLTGSITVQLNDVLPEVVSFNVTPTPPVNCVVALPSTVDTVCNVSVNPGVLYTFASTFIDDNADIQVTEPPNDMAYENIFGFSAREGIAPPALADNVFLSGFNGNLTAGAATYGFSFSGGVNRKSYTTQLQFTNDTLPAGALRMKVDTGTGQTRQHTWNISVLSSLIGFWAGENNFLDSSTVGNDGAILGTTTFGPGQTGQAFNFNGTTDGVMVNPITSFPSNEITVGFWMNTADNSKAGGVFSYASGASNNDFLVFDHRNIRIYRGGASIGTGINTLNDGLNHHLAVTWRGSDGQLRVYVDGVLAFSGVLAAGTSITPGGALALGQEQDCTGGCFDVNQAFPGQLDEVKVHSRVFTAAEIPSLM